MNTRPRDAATTESANDVSNAPLAEPKIRILRLHQVIAVTGLKKSSIYELQALGDFPMSVPLTSTAVGWIEHEVQEWLAKRIAFRQRLRGK